VYLKTLEIQGFKSFPDKVVLEFGHGITSIVGPNGSGKSNISDAVRWVLGEQSVKILRGNKMEDVIFAGTELRKPVGFAEVSLTLDNSSKILPIDFNEVTVTRRVYRSGESEYYINKSACRLKDIHELFMDTGLGKDGYSIIGQGRIDEILSAKSEDRRQVFEEAAGISKYKFRKQEAEKKLELTRQNLLRLKDIINELELQIDPLWEQAEKAKKFLELRQELKVLEINVYLDTIEKLKKSLNEINKDYDIISSQLTDNQSDLKKLENQLEELYAHVKVQDKEIEEMRNNLHNAQSGIERYQNEINILNNNIENNEINIKKIESDMKNINSKITNLKQELADKESLLQNLTNSQKEMQSTIQHLEMENQKIIQSIEIENLTIDSLKSEIIEKMNEISEIKARINSLKVLENNFMDRKKAINKEVVEKTGYIENLSELIKKLEADYELTTSEIINKKETIKKCNIELVNSRQQYSSLINKYNQLVSSSKEKISKKTLLEEMERDFEGYSKSVKQVLVEWKKGKLKNLKIHGVLSQLISVPRQFITAIEVALGPAMQNIVVENEQDAKMAIRFLKSNQLGRATFLPISSVGGNVLDDRGGKISSFPGYLGIASQVVSFDSRYQGIVNSLLGRVVIVDNIDSGIRMAREFGYKFRVVTIEGEVLNPGGSLTGGSVNKINSFLSRAKEIETLNEEITDIQRVITDISKEMDEKAAAIKQLEDYIQEVEKSLKEFESRHITLEADIKHNTSSHHSLLENIKALQKENEQLNEQIDNTMNEILKFSDNIKVLQDEIRQTETIITQKQVDNKAEIEAKENLNQAILDKKITLGSINKDIDVTYERIKVLQYEMDDYENNKKEKKLEYTALHKQNEILRGQIIDKNKEIEGLENSIKTLQNRIEQFLKERNNAEQNISAYQSAIKAKRENISLLQEEFHRLENKKMRTEIELENYVNKLWDDYGQTFTTALEYRKDIGSVSQAQKQINTLKNEIKDLGNVNVNAIEEYKHVKERYEFLSKQKNDLEEAEAGLVKVINDMLHLMKKQFSDQFKVINENFNIVFSQLFGGGRAELRLSDPDDVLESGIEIEVQPPGKKLQNLMLLSGGEKAFTAIALLFAILKVRPTPFCILDEIEAALDDVNVYRFAQYLKQYSQQTQFIVVTHRRGTMEVADILYGVTMQERGISKLISLQMDEVAS
jgi:chromosome segregation protein